MSFQTHILPRLLLIGALAGVSGCASTPDATAQDVMGCYFFEPGDAVETFRLPEGVHLTDRPLEGWPAIMERGDVKVAVTLRTDGTADYPFGYWLLEAADSVEIGYPAGGGIVLDLATDGDALEGIARALGDTRSFGQEDEGPTELPVRLEPGSCPG